MTGKAGTPARRLMLVDLRVCQVHRERGIPVYAQSLLLELPKAMPETDFLIWHDPLLPLPTMAAALQATVGPFRSAEELSSLGQQARITDLLSACILQDYRSGSLARQLYPGWLKAHQARHLGIVYDLIPYLFRERYLADPARLNWYMEGLRCLRRLDHLFAISESARLDAIRLTGLDPARVHNIYGGLDPSKAEAIRTGGTPWAGGRLPESYAVYVGGDDWRKNIDGTIRGFAAYRKAGGLIPVLALVCGMPDARRQDCLHLAESLGLPPGAVVITGKVTDGELVGVVKGAALSVFPSFYEGLGLPVLESYACGVPVLSSDTASLPELVPPACRFDPHDPAGLAGRMLAFDRDPDLRRTSLARGREVLANLTWPTCARRLAEALAHAGGPAEALAPVVAAVGVLPPEQTGIAAVNARHLRLSSVPLHVFSAFPTARDRLAFQSHPWKALAHPRNLPVFQARERYAQRLFVLGNSGHHQPTLEALRGLRDAPGQTWLYLHDGDLLGMWTTDLGDLQAVNALYARTYPEWHGGWRDLYGYDRPRGMRPLLELGREVGIIVNSEWARTRVLLDLGATPALGVHTLFLPVEPHAPSAWRSNPPVLRVGTFGKPEKTKQLDRVVAALEQLGRRRPVRLVVAGFDAAAFLAQEGLLRPDGIEVLDSPADADLLEAMRSVDVAVQLRFPSFGESSGVVGHLLGMGIPLVVTATGSFPELGEAAVQVSAEVTPERLAEAILEAHENQAHHAAAAAYRKAHLPEAFTAALDGLLASHRT